MKTLIPKFNLKNVIVLYANKNKPAILASVLAGVLGTSTDALIKAVLKNKSAFLYDNATFPKDSELVKNADNPHRAVLTVQGMLAVLEVFKENNQANYLDAAAQLSAMFADNCEVLAKDNLAKTLADLLLRDVQTTKPKPATIRQGAWKND